MGDAATSRNEAASGVPALVLDPCCSVTFAGASLDFEPLISFEGSDSSFVADSVPYDRTHTKIPMRVLLKLGTAVRQKFKDCVLPDDEHEFCTTAIVRQVPDRLRDCLNPRGQEVYGRDAVRIRFPDDMMP